jgi:hypothetical protein
MLHGAPQAPHDDIFQGPSAPVHADVRAFALEPDALPAAAVAGVAKDLGWLSELADGKKPFAAVTHCLCELP